jgi:hypothetical protein
MNKYINEIKCFCRKYESELKRLILLVRVIASLLGFELEIYFSLLRIFLDVFLVSDVDGWVIKNKKEFLLRMVKLLCKLAKYFFILFYGYFALINFIII